MTFTTFKANRELDINELREVLSLMEEQETTDRYVSTSLDINGNYANIKVDIDEYGNVKTIYVILEIYKNNKQPIQLTRLLRN